MSDRKRNREAPSRPAERTKSRPAEQLAKDAPQRTAAPVDAVQGIAAARAPGMQLDAAELTPGRAGESHISIEKSWVEVEGHLPASFKVATLAGNALEVTLEQLSYRKTHTGTGSLQTGLTPLAPIGTRGRLIARDLTSGETVEQPWIWHLHGGPRRSLWEVVKGLFWKG